MELPACDCCGNTIKSTEYQEIWFKFLKGVSKGGARALLVTSFSAVSGSFAAKKVADHVFGLDKTLEEKMDEDFKSQFEQKYWWEETDDGFFCPFCNPGRDDPPHDAINCPNA